jgi:hypothetical protein
MGHISMVSTPGAVFPPPVPLLASTGSDDHVDSAADLSPVAGPSSLLDEAANLLLLRSVDGPNITVPNPGAAVPVPDVASLPPVPLLASTVSDDHVDSAAELSPAAVPGSLLGMASDLLLSPAGDPVIPAQNPEAVVPVPDVVFLSPVPLLASIAPDYHTDAGADLSPAAVPGSLLGMASDLHPSLVADPVIPVQIPGVATICSTTLETAASLVDPPTSHTATHDSVPDTLISDVAERLTSAGQARQTHRPSCRLCMRPM